MKQKTLLKQLNLLKILVYYYYQGVTGTVQNEVKEQKRGFLSMLLGTLTASLLGNFSTGKGINRAGEGVLRAGYGNNKMDF